MGRSGSDIGKDGSMGSIVSTERLGSPGSESGRLERIGLVQKHLTYPNEPETPTATCHVQPASESPALCGYQWEGLVAVPGIAQFDQIDPSIRCPKCERLSTV